MVGSEERMQPFLLIMLDNSIDTNLVRLRQDETQASDGNYELNRVTTPGQTTKLYLRIMYKTQFGIALWTGEMFVIQVDLSH